MEQMISELKNGLNADRMSCCKFSANQFRLYLHCAAYVILHTPSLLTEGSDDAGK